MDNNVGYNSFLIQHIIIGSKAFEASFAFCTLIKCNKSIQTPNTIRKTNVFIEKIEWMSVNPLAAVGSAATAIRMKNKYQGTHIMMNVLYFCFSFDSHHTIRICSEYTHNRTSYTYLRTKQIISLRLLLLFIGWKRTKKGCSVSVFASNFSFALPGPWNN